MTACRWKNRRLSVVGPAATENKSTNRAAYLRFDHNGGWVSQLEEGGARQSLFGANLLVQNRLSRDAWQIRNGDGAINPTAMIAFVNAHKNSSWLPASP
jgi:hypothetical protein